MSKNSNRGRGEEGKGRERKATRVVVIAGHKDTLSSNERGALCGWASQCSLAVEVMSSHLWPRCVGHSHHSLARNIKSCVLSYNRLLGRI